MRSIIALTIGVSIGLLLFPITAQAQFSGPTAERATLTVEASHQARVGTYAIVTGQIVNRLREDYYTFRDATGTIRVEIAPEVWNGQRVDPESTVQLFVEVDRTRSGRRYLWVESLTVIAPDA